jgi:hypothetical protein
VGAVAYACTLVTSRAIWNLGIGLTAGSVVGLAFLAAFDRAMLTEMRNLLRSSVAPAANS